MSHIFLAPWLAQAIRDGHLFVQGWVAGKVVVASCGTRRELSTKERWELFQRFFAWRRDIEPTLPAKNRQFVATASNGQIVWVMEWGAVIILLYPQEY